MVALFLMMIAEANGLNVPPICWGLWAGYAAIYFLGILAKIPAKKE